MGAVAGVQVASLSPGLARSPVTASVGPGPVERVVRDLVRPHGVAAVYGAGPGQGRLLAVVVVPAGHAPDAAAASGPARPSSGTLPDIEELSPTVDPRTRERAVLALGEDLDDLEAVALLEAAARGDSGLPEDDPARLLARSLLSTLPGLADDEEEAGPAGS